MGSAFHQLCPRYSGTLTPTAPTAIKLWDTFTFIYWLVGVHPDDQDKTAFVTADGLYNFKVMPYGLCNSGATFERLMELVLAGLHWMTCLLYVDGIICFSKTVKEHITRLDEILSRIREAGLKLSPGKYKLFSAGSCFPGPHRVRIWN